jgi:hypothetical protein
MSPTPGGQDDSAGVRFGVEILDPAVEQGDLLGHLQRGRCFGGDVCSEGVEVEAPLPHSAMVASAASIIAAARSGHADGYESFHNFFHNFSRI